MSEVYKDKCLKLPEQGIELEDEKIACENYAIRSSTRLIRILFNCHKLPIKY